MKQIIKAVVRGSAKALISASEMSRTGRYFKTQLCERIVEATREVTHKGVNLSFGVPNEMCRYRVTTFSTKEPETLDWIDSLRGTLWDVGANIGLYSCYAAKRGLDVVAFEPSIFNLEWLARNTHLNQVAVTVVPLPLTDETLVSSMRLSAKDWGGSMSTFDKDYGHDGKALTSVFEFKTLGIAVADLHIPRPNHIKIDVDGIEHLILRGAREALKTVDSVLIEINHDFKEQAQECFEELNRAGLKPASKAVADVTGHFQSTFNHVFRR